MCLPCFQIFDQFQFAMTILIGLPHRTIIKITNQLAITQPIIDFNNYNWNIQKQRITLLVSAKLSNASFCNGTHREMIKYCHKTHRGLLYLRIFAFKMDSFIWIAGIGIVDLDLIRIIQTMGSVGLRARLIYTSYVVAGLRADIEQAHQKAKGSLFTLDIDETLTVSDEHLTMVYYLMEKLKKKQTTHFDLPKDFNPFLHPDPALTIKDMGDRHRLLFNKFNIFHNHLLVVTKEFESQSQMISEGDMLNAALVCQALDGVLFFNGGEFSGASQKHKHLQLLPKEAKELPIFKQIAEFVSNKVHQNKNLTVSSEILTFPHFDFLHGVIAIPQDQTPLGDKLFKAYNSLHQHLIQNNKDKYDLIRDYNIFADSNLLFMVIRKKQHAFDKVSVNTLGYMGSLLFKSRQQLQQFRVDRTPSGILSDISLR